VGHPRGVFALVLPDIWGLFGSRQHFSAKEEIFDILRFVSCGNHHTLSMLKACINFLPWGQAGVMRFGIMTMFIAIPTAAQVFNWILTMFRDASLMTIKLVFRVL